ncbi:hypothetical protein ACFX15_037613 [Malus domestica]
MIAMKNEVLQEQYEKLFKTLHETMRTQTRELVTLMDINHHLDASTRSRRSGGRHILAEGLEGSKVVYRDCRDFLKQRQENPLHICSKINNPRISEKLGPLPRPKPTTNLEKEQQVLEEHEGDGDLRKKFPVVHGSTQDLLVLQLFEEVNKLKAERQAEIPDWNQPRPGPLTRRSLDTFFKRRQNKSLVYNYVLEGMTQLNTLTSLSPPWHIRCISMKRDTDRLYSTDDLYIIRQKPNESLREYAGRFSHEYSRCAEVDDKIALKAFTAGLRDCFFKYMINANTGKTYSEVMAQAYNHASAEPSTTRGIKVRIKTTRGERTVDYYDYGAKPHSFKVED